MIIRIIKSARSFYIAVERKDAGLGVVGACRAVVYCHHLDVAAMVAKQGGKVANQADKVAKTWFGYDPLIL